MLKHVQVSPMRSRTDSLSIRSSTSCSSSLCGSPEPPPEIRRTPSRASSYSSLNEPLPQTTIKIHTSCLRNDIEYKTLGVQWDTTSKDVIGQLLRRLKMRHRDPRLFYLSMEVTVRRAGIKTLLTLDDEARPAILQACHPKGDSRICLQMRPGGLVRVHTTALQSSSRYKSLVISEETTSDELLALLLSCYNSAEPVEQFSLYEVCPAEEYQRKLHPDDIPLHAQYKRMQRGETCHFLVRRNPNYPRRRQLLPSLTDTSSLTTSDESSKDKTENRTEADTKDKTILPSTDKDKTENTENDKCRMCHDTFKSCEFCNKNSTTITKKFGTINLGSADYEIPQYNPVYNIREIRTISHCFSPLGADKKFLDTETPLRVSKTTVDTNRNRTNTEDFNKNVRHSTDCNMNITSINGEAVKNDPAKGLGHYIYI